MSGNGNDDKLLAEFERALAEELEESDKQREATLWPPPVQETPGRSAKDIGKSRGDFAELMSEIELSPVRDEHRSATQAPSAAKVARRSAKTESRATAKAGGRELSPEEAMEEAFGEMGGDRAIHSRKYSGVGVTLSDDVEIRYDEATEPEPGGADSEKDATRDELLFLEEMASDDVSPIDQRIELRDKSRAETMAWFTVDQITRLSAEDLMEPSITADQRVLLKRSRKTRMRVLNVRLMRRPEAQGEVEAMVLDATRADERFVRIITGKGRNSPGEPVLKRMVIEWVEDAVAVRGWAPETDSSGNFGSVVIELRSKSRRG